MTIVQQSRPKTVLILGSAPDVLQASDWDRSAFDKIVVINNAWNVRPDWDFLIHPDDFEHGRLPQELKTGQTIVTARDYVPVQNDYGGFVYAGATMAFTAGYWALGALRPDTLAFFGCDMNYGKGQTHFYGNGSADPLRNDMTLQSLEAKSVRLMLIAAAQGCLTINLSSQVDSRLLFPRASLETVCNWTRQNHASAIAPLAGKAGEAIAAIANRREAELNYMAISGRYWDEAEKFDPEELRRLDALWLRASQQEGFKP